VKPHADDTKVEQILRVLSDGAWHDGAAFLDGRHGFRCSSYSQRVSQLIREGWPIERRGPGGHELGTYRLVTRESTSLRERAREAPSGAFPHHPSPATRRCATCEGCPEDHCATCADAPKPDADQQPFRFALDGDEASAR
jgi:hypothetical protein